MATLTITTPAALTLADGGSDLLPGGVAEIIVNAPAGVSLADAGNANLGSQLVLSVAAPLAMHAAFDLVYTYSTGSLDTTNAILVGFTTTASIQIGSPNFSVAETADLELRLMPSVVIDMPTPIVVNGHPIVPRFLGTYPSSMPLVIGSSHIHVIPDPNPVWNPATSGWFYPPPASGIGDARWVVDDLPNPSGFPGSYYWLGTPSPFDGTSSIAAGCRQWKPNGSTPSAPSWASVYPYKPSVWEHVNYGAGGKQITLTRGVRFNLQFIEAMWMEWASDQTDPFSWIMVGIIMDFPTPNYVHTLLDVGGSPVTHGAGVLNTSQLNVDRALTDRVLSTPYRPAMFVYPNQVRQIANLDGADQILTTFNAAIRPKMFFGVWNRGNSYMGNYSTAGKYVKKGTMPAVLQRFAIIGREGGILSRNRASHLVLFEMRYFHSALSLANLDDQYNQLSATWKFKEYH